jgi:hypothetical protein
MHFEFWSRILIEFQSSTYNHFILKSLKSLAGDGWIFACWSVLHSNRTQKTQELFFLRLETGWDLFRLSIMANAALWRILYFE